jgi:hypothetical protein
MCAALMATMYRHLRAKSLEIFFGMEEDDARSTAKLHVTAPTATVAQIAQARDLFVKTIAESGSLISMKFNLSLRQTCALDNLVVLLLHADALVHYGTPQRVAACASFVAEREPWLANSNIAILSEDITADDKKTPPTPVLGYRMSQLQKALYQLGAVLNRITWDLRVVAYTDLLRIRCGVYLACSFPGLSNDVLSTCTLIKREDSFINSVFSTNQKFVWLVSDVFVDVISKLCARASVREASQALRDELHVSSVRYWARLRGRFVKWIERKLEEINSSEPSGILKDYLLRLNLRPGELSGYGRSNPSAASTTEVQYVISAYREVEFRILIRQNGRTYADVLKKDYLAKAKAVEDRAKRIPRMRPDAPFEPEQTHVVLCILELIQSHATAKFNSMNFRDYYILEPDSALRMPDVESCDYPIMLQTFNHFGLATERQVIPCNSLVWSFLMWCLVVMMKHDFNLAGCSLKEWIREIAPLEVWDGWDAEDDDSESSDESSEASEESAIEEPQAPELQDEPVSEEEDDSSESD